MRECTETQLEMLELLQGRLTPAEKARIEDHTALCEACGHELTSLGQTWRALPALVDVRPPTMVRESVLAYALSSQEEVAGTRVEMKRVARAFVSPVALGAAGAFAVISLASLRGALDTSGPMTVLSAGLVLAAMLAVVGGALLKSAASGTLRAILLGALGAFGSYWVLSVALPVSTAVGLCGLALFGGMRMSIGQLCLVYLIVAGLYAGVPLAIAAYLWGGPDKRWQTGLAEAAIFLSLVAPLAMLQSGAEGWMITATLLLGLLIGSLAGGLLGGWAGGRRHRGMAAV